MRQQTKELALASMFGALAVLFLFLGGVLPLAFYACPLLASACLLPVREECRKSVFSGTRRAPCTLLRILSQP